ncbi:hypothetical protein V473_08575 [Sphingobium cupriresistens LL01]|uniref:Uncharacterized protein n=1 Tax=Sphingobium cupriresistens LL01 TaxID=1420583 RepID=A0A0J8AX92_9SPHN|nr:hypothetical protein V473_08575 [Sphingobium cupriresistens LL01]
MRGYLDAHVDVIARKRAVDDRHAHFGTDLSDNLANPQTHLAMQHIEPIFRYPEEMIAMIQYCVTNAAIAHSRVQG